MENKSNAGAKIGVDLQGTYFIDEKQFLDLLIHGWGV
jgi:hypothetical protein